MITVENLSFTYRKSKRAVLHDFSLSFESGRVYGLLGKNGAGKSTLLYLMSGLLTPKNGKVVFHDTDVRRRLPVTLQDMFLVPEEFELPSVSLVSYVELNSPFYPRFSKEEMIKYLHYFEMDIDIDLGSLSMGQKKFETSRLFVITYVCCIFYLYWKCRKNFCFFIMAKSDYRRTGGNCGSACKSDYQQCSDCTFIIRIYQ